MNSSAINIENVGKRYLITHGASNYRTLRETITDVASAPFRRLRRGGGIQKEEFWALRDVSLQIQPGEVVGMVGRNGAGKSTFLKILSRITKPTTGRITFRGRIGSLLEVGTGFHPELSGRENIFLNGAILGMSRREITEKFDEIVEFAEVTQFLDTPVKRYSSGMYVRLAFAVAAHLEPEILLVDEVLAVGDAAFQRKCMGKMSQVARQGRTILFVSHNMGAITRLCEKVLWFEKGRLKESGPAEQTVARYLSSGVQDLGEVTFRENGNKPPGSEFVELEAVRIRDRNGRITSTLDVRFAFKIEIQYRVLQRTSNLRIGARINTHDGTVLLISTDRDGREEIQRDPGVYTSQCEIPGELLNYGQYSVSVGSDFPMVRTHFQVDPALTFHIEQTGGSGDHLYDGRSGYFRLQLPWKVEAISS